MMLAYGAGALVLFLAGQQGGLQQLQAALDGEGQTLDEVLGQAQRVVGSGMSLGQAALLIGFVPVILRLLQMATPFTNALAEWMRRKLLGEHRRPDDSPPPV